MLEAGVRQYSEWGNTNEGRHTPPSRPGPTLRNHGVSAIGSPPGAVRGYATGPRFLGAFPQMRIPIDDLQVRHAPKAEQ